MERKYLYYIALGVGVFGLIFLLFIVLAYGTVWAPQPGGVIPCGSNFDCPANSYCTSNGTCASLTCMSGVGDCDKLPGSTCIGITNTNSTLPNYCQMPRCQNSNDCPSGSICGASKRCLPYNSTITCKSGFDCYGGELPCMNGVCAQCNSDNQCDIGQICRNGVCLYPSIGSTQCNSSSGFIPVGASALGYNPRLPYGFCCSSGTLGSACPCPSGQFCINGQCRCVKGQLFETCRSNTDCASNNCIPGPSSLGTSGVCGFTGGAGLGAQQCLTNYNPNVLSNNPLSCSSASPYCINGTCQKASLGAFCGGGFNASNSGLCNGSGVYTTSIAKFTNVADIPPAPPNGMGPFCVNFTCSSLPGGLNSACNSDFDCGSFVNSSLGENLSFKCINNHCVSVSP